MNSADALAKPRSVGLSETTFESARPSVPRSTSQAATQAATQAETQVKPKDAATVVLPDIDRPARMTTQEYAYQRLRTALMLGSISPGAALTIRGLSATLGISPTPVREALRRLSSEYAILVQENRRICVPTMTAERFEELISFRAVVESHAAGRAVPYISDLLVDQMVQIDTELEKAIDLGLTEQQLILNQRFHSTLYLAHPNVVALPVIESIWLQLGPFMRIAGEHVRDLYRVDHHQKAILALRKRDVNAVEAAIRDDIYEGVGGLDSTAIVKILQAVKPPTDLNNEPSKL